MGMSDIVSALLAIYKMTGLVTFHGPGVLSTSMSPYTEESLVRSLTSADPIGEVRNPPHGPQIQTISEGKAEGELTGGNLDLVLATLATKYEIDMKGKIFFFEAAMHRTWEIDRFLTHLELTGKLRSAVGFVAGPMAKCDPAERTPMERQVINPATGHPDALLDFNYSSTVEEVLQERLSRLSVPAIYGLCCGHTADLTVLPIGVNAVLDGTNGKLQITESALSP
jgi:muramoyltetrapeptide carboxypeptidase